MATQVKLTAEPRTDLGKGASGRLRKTGRVPGILYGADIGGVSLHVDNLELYHSLRTESGMNVLIRLEVEGEEHLSIIREIQRHPVRGDLMHVDFQNVDRTTLYPAEIPVHLENEDDTSLEGGVVNMVLYTVPIHVRPLETPNYFTLDLAGLTIGEVLRVEDLADQLPEAAEFDIEPERTVVTINAPISEEELEALEAPTEEAMEVLEGEEEPAEAGDEDASAEADAAQAEGEDDTDA